MLLFLPPHKVDFIAGDILGGSTGKQSLVVNSVLHSVTMITDLKSDLQFTVIFLK